MCFFGSTFELATPAIALYQSSNHLIQEGATKSADEGQGVKTWASEISRTSLSKADGSSYVADVETCWEWSRACSTTP